MLQVDGYTGYDSLAKSDRPGGAITLAYCLAHARREFFDVDIWKPERFQQVGRQA